MSSFSQLLNISRSTMQSCMRNLDLVSNNLANVNTTAFKRSRSNFQELLSAQGESGVEMRTTQGLMDQGTLQNTENAMDVAIEGEGFFQVALADGQTAYTRDGQFFLDAERNLVTANGYYLQWDGKIPENAAQIHFNPDGTVMALIEDTWTQIGTVPLSRFANPGGLQIVGDNLFLASAASGEAEDGQPLEEGFGKLVGGALEGSNVNMSEEMTQMVVLQRNYQMSIKAFQQADQMLGQAIQMRRG